ncbi:MAG: type II secretion system F family protein, partial [Planctomycetaceae bacterium]
LALLVDGATPFPESLRLAGGAANVGIAAAANQLADDVSAGLDPVDAALQNTTWPRWMVPIFRWHDRGPAFAEALETAADLCVTQSHEQLSLAMFVTEPAVIMGIAFTVGYVVISLFLPLVKLLNELS